jgi:5,10-methylenetetrahydrofolate reductase
MTREDIIRMAREAGINVEQGFLLRFAGVEDDLERFAALIAAQEREECRLIVLDNSDAEGICCTDDVLEAFRQRGEK